MKKSKKFILSIILAITIFTETLVYADDGIMPCDVNYNGTFYYCDVDSTIVQETENWCGMASTLMALTGIEKYSSNQLKSGYVRPSQTQIAKMVRNEYDSAVVYKIVDYLNDLLIGSKYKYSSYFSKPSEDDIIDKIKLSLAANRPVILRCYPYYAFKYYNGKVGTRRDCHYVVIDEYDANTGTFNIVDPTYINVNIPNATQYQGRHRNISIGEIVNSMKTVTEKGNEYYDGYIIYS